MNPRKSPYMNFLLLLSCLSEPRRIVFSCVILVTAVAAGVVYAGVSVLVGFLLSLTALLLTVNILSFSLSTLTEQQDRVLKIIRVTEFGIGYLFGMMFFYGLLVFRVIPDLERLLQTGGME